MEFYYAKQKNGKVITVAVVKDKVLGHNDVELITKVPTYDEVKKLQIQRQDLQWALAKYKEARSW